MNLLIWQCSQIDDDDDDGDDSKDDIDDLIEDIEADVTPTLSVFIVFCRGRGGKMDRQNKL